jgi:hypothetical protein
VYAIAPEALFSLIPKGTIAADVILDNGDVNTFFTEDEPGRKSEKGQTVFRRQVAELLANAGYPDPQRETPRFFLRATFTRRRSVVFHPTVGNKRLVEMSVSWDLLDAGSDKVVYHKETVGYDEGPSGDFTLGAAEAFESALRAVLADPHFVVAVSR